MREIYISVILYVVREGAVQGILSIWVTKFKLNTIRYPKVNPILTLTCQLYKKMGVHCVKLSFNSPYSNSFLKLVKWLQIMKVNLLKEQTTGI